MKFGHKLKQVGSIFFKETNYWFNCMRAIDFLYIQDMHQRFATIFCLLFCGLSDRASDVGNFFTWNVTQEDQCFGTNPEGEDGIQAQGSWQSEGAFKGVQSAMASFGSPHYADYLVDSFANSWTKNIGIDGYTIDCSANYPAAAGNKQCPNGMLQCEGDAQVCPDYLQSSQKRVDILPI